MARSPLRDEREYIVNFDGKMIHTRPAASESCNTDDAPNKARRSGAQLKNEEYADYSFCKFCF